MIQSVFGGRLAKDINITNIILPKRKSKVQKRIKRDSLEKGSMPERGTHSILYIRSRHGAITRGNESEENKTEWKLGTWSIRKMRNKRKNKYMRQKKRMLHQNRFQAS